ncbi:MAG: hypothetical protein ACOC33_00535 [bacterium]
MLEIVVYIKKDYSINKSIWVNKSLSKDEVTKKVNEEFGKQGWYYYDVLDENNDFWVFKK